MNSIKFSSDELAEWAVLRANMQRAARRQRVQVIRPATPLILSSEDVVDTPYTPLPNYTEWDAQNRGPVRPQTPSPTPPPRHGLVRRLTNIFRRRRATTPDEEQGSHLDANQALVWARHATRPVTAPEQARESSSDSSDSGSTSSPSGSEYSDDSSVVSDSVFSGFDGTWADPDDSPMTPELPRGCTNNKPFLTEAEFAEYFTEDFVIELCDLYFPTDVTEDVVSEADADEDRDYDQYDGLVRLFTVSALPRIVTALPMVLPFVWRTPVIPSCPVSAGTEWLTMPKIGDYLSAANDDRDMRTFFNSASSASFSDVSMSPMSPEISRSQPPPQKSPPQTTLPRRWSAPAALQTTPTSPRPRLISFAPLPPAPDHNPLARRLPSAYSAQQQRRAKRAIRTAAAGDAIRADWDRQLAQNRARKVERMRRREWPLWKRVVCCTALR
ncbi:hypothetical protein BT63DRAFT_458328 [Microthyrium microscopicum]|uniref:Uncharacterized protein n=1 Tax=Microthyrium microscopicum TaxID=703497 RepID=A0A6A6U4T5_9PEZI|nr:hypothetical protein BT63DRAFT_458328 [Microthyrium microscopicum]